MTTTRTKPRLIALIWPFVAVVLVQAIIASVSIHTLSAIRAYIASESVWSKAQKDAIYLLDRYVETRNELYYLQFENAIAIPLGDRIARLALDGPTADFKEAERGFQLGGNHRDDLAGLIWLFQNFRFISYLDKSLEPNGAAEPFILELEALGRSIRSEISAGPVSAERTAFLQAEIYLLDRQITPITLAFSRSLGEGSRAIKNVLLVVNVASAITLIVFAVWRTRKLIGQRQAAEAALDTERERAQITLSSLGEAVVTIGAGGFIDYLNPTAERLFSMPAEHVRGRPLYELFTLVNNETGKRDWSFLTNVLGGERASLDSETHKLLRKDGSPVVASLVGAPLGREGKLCGAVLVFHDMTREQEYMARLSWQASHDALTDLANRRVFEQRLERALAGLSRGASTHVLMFVDLDQFKLVNDTCGHAAGDRLLQQVSTALASELRQGDLLARLGGDEFGVLMEDCEPALAAEAAERLRRTVEELAFVWNGRPFSISASVGVVHVSEPGTTLEEALRAADVACYMAKEKGRNRIQIQEPADTELLERVGEMAWVQRIRDALDEDRFCLYAQEIVPLQEREAGRGHVEVLVRLRDENGQMVAPQSFIAPAERYGLMPLIDRWVVRNTFAELARREQQGLPIDICAINLSGSSFGDEGFVDFLREELLAHRIAPQSICFEITETSAIADMSTAIAFMGAMRGLGCSFALDDFGSGMSSFSYLKHLPVDYLKIDGGFVKDMLSDRNDRAMVEMIHHVGQVMGKITIAEFVESAEIATALREIGIGYAQGFAVARPAPFDDSFRLAGGTFSAQEPAVREWQRRIGRTA
ncbi:EAL domain-containing protein [Mesorhizobium sp. BAC0120]|uniref:EAL domain-containing protein n=1 Tax=Mesorhizobium sp. BAC0120 TaxID=3090670 RepID=UPI00298C72D6|nr:EAL domain-containing protein [Mesorhizobium sp. BAC0120]MDW6025681.1 EAL domain-containing protein [Mesorhizobium sp. BAC0120]